MKRLSNSSARGLHSVGMAFWILALSWFIATPGTAGEVLFEYDSSGQLKKVTHADGSTTLYAVGSNITDGCTAPADTEAPTQPGPLSVTSIAETSATVSWAASTDNVAVTGYDYQIGSGSWIALGVTTSVGLSGLNPTTHYSIGVRARDAAGHTSIVRTGSFDTIDVTAPTQPGALSFGAVTETTATASWGASTDNVAVVGYDYRRNSESWISLGNVTSVNLAGLLAATGYTIEVRARDAAGHLSTTRSSSFTTPDTTAPSQPGALSFSAIATTSATVNWGAATDNVAVTGYDYSLSGGAWIPLGNVTSYSLGGLTASTGYTVDVRARDAAGLVSTVRSGSFSTAAPPPFTATIAVNGAAPVDLRALANAAGYNGADNANITFQVAAGVTIMSATNGAVAIDTGTWPTGSFTINLTLQVSGNVYGGGGKGGSDSGGTAATAGGDAIYCRTPLAITVNSGGSIKGGGGGGGKGGFAIGGSPIFPTVNGGNGGGGFPNGAAGGVNAGAGTTSGGGAGGPGSSFLNGQGGAGGAGGGAGATGATGGNGVNATGATNPGATGGAAGYAVRKNGNSVTVTNNGTIAGPQG